MKYTIKKSNAVGYKEKPYHAERVGSNGFYAFATLGEALQHAYDNGAEDINVHYSNFVMRAFTRQSLENFKLVKVAK